VASLDGRRLRLLSRGEDGGERETGTGTGGGENDSESSQVEFRKEGTSGQPVVTIAPYIKPAKSPIKGPPRRDKTGEAKTITPGIKKRRSGKKGEEDMPPTPWGCEWLKTDDGWNLWRYWSEKDRTTGQRIKKNRYTGYLSHDAWQVMKGYDYETFISIIGQRFRRYGQR
jgi:hypothetical protein